MNTYHYKNGKISKSVQIRRRTTREYTLSTRGLISGKAPTHQILLLFLVSLLISILLSGCGRAVNRSAERRIREALPDLIGQATRYQVHVEGDASRTINGNIARITIDGENVELSNGLLIDRLHLTLEGVRFDPDRRILRDIRASYFEAKVSANTIDEYLAGESPLNEKLRKIRVSFGNGNHVTVAGERLTFGLAVPFRLSGPLYVRESNGVVGVELDPSRLEVVNIPITGIVLHFIMEKFAHIGSLSTLPFPVHIERVATQPGYLMVSGRADTAALMRRVSPSTSTKGSTEPAKRVSGESEERR